MAELTYVVGADGVVIVRDEQLNSPHESAFVRYLTTRVRCSARAPTYK